MSLSRQCMKSLPRMICNLEYARLSALPLQSDCGFHGQNQHLQGLYQTTPKMDGLSENNIDIHPNPSHQCPAPDMHHSRVHTKRTTTAIDNLRGRATLTCLYNQAASSVPAHRFCNDTQDRAYPTLYSSNSDRSTMV